MVSIPFPSFFSISASCILLFFSQKALILLWAGNTLDLCVTANYHGNRRESRLHRSFYHLLLLPWPATSGAILTQGQENGRFSRRFLKKKIKKLLLPPPNTHMQQSGISPSPSTEEGCVNCPCSLKQQLMPDPAHDLDHRLETPNQDQMLQSQNK